ncbi:oxidoreductase [Lonepinella sp. BR2357]|uniref:oxidoreductase n=1 Tax=Lonepinella sp. BR2357 TaxID=3434549 RepID=UPI003F6E11CE
MNKLNLAIAAEFELCEKITEFLQQSRLEISQLTVVEIYPFNEEQGVRFNNKSVAQIPVAEVDWSAFDYVLFAGKTEQAPHIANAAEQGCVVIDMLGLCASISAVPVIVPTVNDELITELRQRNALHNIIALPNPQITQTVLALSAFMAQYPINQAIVSSLVPASYHNGETVSKLVGQTARLLNGIPLDENEPRFAFDVAPLESSYATQINKIFPTLSVVYHSIQVPVFYGLAQKITALSDYQIDLEQIKSTWQQQDLIQLEEKITPVLNGEQENNEETVKLHISDLKISENGVEFWTVADEQRFNLACLAVQLLERLFNQQP